LPGPEDTKNASPGPAAGGRFGRYQIERLLGKGAMGAVYLARQLDLARHVVIKVMTASEITPALVERFHREARAAAGISSDHVVRVYDVGVVEREPFIAMEYVAGESADDLIGRGPVPFEQAARIVIDAAKGLQAAHEVGVLHRDVKPGNVLITKDGRAKVTDFGLATPRTRVGAVQLTEYGTTVGTPAYMAPEQAEGIDVLDARADVYALGVTFYELLTATLPFPGRSMVDIYRLKQEARFTPPSQVVPSIPEPIEQVCVAMMARAKTLRPASMKEVVDRLESARGATLTSVVRASLAIVPQGMSLVGGPAVSPSLVADPNAETLPPATVFGRYVIERFLGRGSMGAVYLARQVDLDRLVVLKMVQRSGATEPEVLERLRRDAVAVARIESDFVVRVYDAGVERGMAFVSMEYVEGSSLAELVRKRGRLSPLEATRAVLGMARGLKAAHDLGILHCDVRPANVLVTKAGKIKVADFGLARHATASQRAFPGTIGTPLYAAPEQLMGTKLDGRADAFSLGITYYNLLTGALPFAGSSPREILTSRAQPVRPPREHVPTIPIAAERACLCLMETEPDNRPRDMDAVLQLLQPVVAKLAGKGGGRWPTWLVATITGGVVVVAGLAVALAVAAGRGRSPVVAGSGETGAQEALAAARGLPPAESAAELERIAHAYPATKAAAAAAVERPVVADLAADLDSTKHAVESATRRLDFDTADRSIQRLEPLLDAQGAYTRQLSGITGLEGPDTRIQRARDALATIRGRVAAVKKVRGDLDHGFADARSELVDGLLGLRLEPAEQRLAALRELDAKLRGLLGPESRPDPQVDACATVLVCASAARKLAGGSVPADGARIDAETLPRFFSALVSSKELNDEGRIGGQLVAACLGKPIPPELGIDGKNREADERLAVCLKFLRIGRPAVGGR
jgi:serine/threonine protein kinase